MITLMNAKKSKRQISFSRQSLAGGGCLGYFDKSFLGKKAALQKSAAFSAIPAIVTCSKSA